MAIKVHGRPIYKFGFVPPTSSVIRTVHILNENPKKPGKFLIEGFSSGGGSLEYLGIGRDYFFTEKEALNHLLESLKKGIESCEEHLKTLE